VCDSKLAGDVLCRRIGRAAVEDTHIKAVATVRLAYPPDLKSRIECFRGVSEPIISLQHVDALGGPPNGSLVLVLVENAVDSLSDVICDQAEVLVEVSQLVNIFC